jgi:transcriptional regulator with XRE-family HTH domain
VTEVEMGPILRTARESAGLSLAALAHRIHFSRQHLSLVERGQRRATPEIVRAYEDALGDHMNRRQLLTALAVGAATPVATAKAVTQAFEQALAAPRMTNDDWLERAEQYGYDYMTLGAGDVQARLAADLVRLQSRLDDPVLGPVAARLATVNGKTMPAAGSDRSGAISWYRIGADAADRSDNVDTQVWTRGRAALALAYEGAELAVARSMAEVALAISDRPSLGRLNAQLAIAHVQGLRGDRDGALLALDDAQRTFDRVGSDEQISDFAIPEWRYNVIKSMLLSRLGVEDRAIDAQDTVERTRPAGTDRFGVHVQLHKGLMLVKSGAADEGVAYARRALDELPREKHSLSLRLMMDEIDAAAAA